MIFATDLDGTMIYNHRTIKGYENEMSCVEYIDKRPITYMTNDSIKNLEILEKKAFVIPVTTRTTAQLQRVKYFSSMKYVIAANGGTILINGIESKVWKNRIDHILPNYDFNSILAVFSKILPYLSENPTIVDEKYVFARAKDINLCRQVLENEINAKIWKMLFHRQKIYIIPNDINKKNAIQFIKEEILPDNLLVSSGDSILDKCMLEYSDYAIISKGSKLTGMKHKNLIVVEDGLYAGNEILKTAIELTKNTKR